MTDKIIVITGGLGFIGKHLIREVVLTNPTKIYVIDDLSNSSENDFEEFKEHPVELIIHDVSTKLPDLNTSIDYIFHLAALVSVPESFEHPLRTHQVNETGFINVLEFCKVYNVKKLIYASSCAVYGSSPNVPLAESERVVPESPYGLTKLNNEYYARFFHQAYGLESIGLRFFNVFGPGQKPISAYAGVISIFMDRAKKDLELTIYGNGEQFRDFIYVEDIARALIAASESQVKMGVYNVGTGKPTSLNDLFQTIAHIAAYKKAPIYAAPRLGDVEKSCADVSRIENDMNYSPTYSLEEGLLELYKSIKN